MKTETVYDIAQLLRRRNNDVGAPDFDDWNIADRLEAAHTREIRSKYSENNRLRALVGELADALDAAVPDHADCEDTKALCKGGCMPNGICRQSTIRALVEMAREAAK